MAGGMLMLLGVAGCASTFVKPDVVAGDAARGREIVMGRDGNCLLCHTIPATGARFMGSLGPSLEGVGARFDAAQLRLRLTDPQRFNADSIMPAYARTGGLSQVAEVWRGKPILSEQQIDDVVAYLGLMR